MASRRLSEADELILEAATGARELAQAKLQMVLEYVAQAGFDPAALERVRGRLARTNWSLTIVRESRELRGPRGHEWVLVQYRVNWGHWVTAYQPLLGLAELRNPNWSDVRWLRQPTSSSGSSPP